MKLAGIFDRELVDSSTSVANNTSGDNANVSYKKIPRFARLFQLSLDNVGEKVQTAAREKALERQHNSNDEYVMAKINIQSNDGENENVGGDVIEQLKSPEELQLWALIDMMVQSKTRVKWYMGSLGSKGSFR